MVLATQNPIEQEGTYPLPEAQMDRFLMHIYIDYPDEASEAKIIRLVRGEEDAAAAAGGPEPIAQSVVFAAREEIHKVTVSPAIEKYMVDWHSGEWHGEITPDGAARGDKANAWKAGYHNGRSMIECLQILKQWKD